MSFSHRSKYRKGDTYSACTITEQDRVEMSFRQPPSMQNYTELGFKKIKAPDGVCYHANECQALHNNRLLCS